MLFELITSKDFLSKFKPETSLIISTPHFKPFFITSDFLVSKDIFILGKLYDEYIICANGRFHYYEGYKYNNVAAIIDVFKVLGCECVIMTNASGSIVKEWNVGDLMLINGHLDYSFMESKQNPNVITDERYNSKLLNKIKKLADDLNIILRDNTLKLIH